MPWSMFTTTKEEEEEEEQQQQLLLLLLLLLLLPQLVLTLELHEELRRSLLGETHRPAILSSLARRISAADW